MNTKNIFLLFFSLILFSCGSDDDAPEDNVNILDHVEDRAFKDYLIKDIFNGKTFATRSDASKVTIIEYTDDNNETKSLKGLEFFTNLDSLFLYNTAISSLDLSYNIKLKKLDFSYNKTLKDLDLSKNTELISFISVVTSISNLNVSNNTKLEALLLLSVEYLSSLDLSKSKKMKELYLGISLHPKSVKVSKSIKDNMEFIYPGYSSDVYDWVD